MRMSLREGHNNEVGSIEPLVLHEVRDEGDSLDGFSKTHLVRQDPVQVIVVEGNQPLQTFNLTDKEATVRRGESLSDVTKPSRPLFTCLHLIHSCLFT